MSATDKLKPCPFCGGEASWIAARQWEDGTYYPAMCGCRKCGIWHCGDSNYGHGGFANEEDRKVSMEQAVSKWNTRTPEQAIADELNAALGGGECELIKHGSLANWPEMVCWSCSACGFGWHHSINDKQFSYCPNCGRKVKR